MGCLNKNKGQLDHLMWTDTPNFFEAMMGEICHSKWPFCANQR